MQNLTHRKAKLNDIKAIVELLLEDELGQNREHLDQLEPYIKAFHEIDKDPNQYLMVVENDSEIIATSHLTIMPSLTFTGSTRMQIEAVRTKASLRGQNIGGWMINQAIIYGRARGAILIQLTTNKKRPRAKHFYEKLGFEPTHEGMKLYLK